MLAEDRQRHPRRSIIVTATRWSGGWELEIGEHQHTQVRDLRNARQQVVDYLDTMDRGVDHADVDITIGPDIGALADEVAHAREATRAEARNGGAPVACRSSASVHSWLLCI